MLEPANELLKRSWERSRLYGVDEAKAQDAVLDESSFKEYREQNHWFLREVNPVIEQLAYWCKNDNCIVAVMDKSGYLLDRAGDPQFLADSQKLSIHKGACWSEEFRGTNGAGIVLVEQRPLSVVGKDYFLEKNRILFGAAAPIFNPDGELQGVLDIIGFSSKYHPSLLGMVDIVSRNLEDQLLMNLSERKMVLSLHPEGRASHKALLAIDQDGVIIGTNRVAREQFHIGRLTNEKIELSNLLAGSERLLDRHTEKCPANSFTLYSEKDGKKTSWIASVMMDTRSVVISLSREPRSIAKAKITKSMHAARYAFSDIYGQDKKLQEAILLAKRAAATDYTILIKGESGTGKEMFSQAVHHASARSDKPFIAINCGAITRSLLESELFGYEAGAFTGARQSGHPGKFELAHGGTLFLDEIAEMPPEMQVALLRVLQDFSVTRIGGTRPIEVDVRIIAATHKDLWKKVQEGSFRADLFYRLQGIQINLPPIRERSDRLLLARHLLKKIECESQQGSLILSAEAETLVEKYQWPGNVRQMIGALREAAFVASGRIIEVQHFPEYILEHYKERESRSPYLLEESERKKITEALQTTGGNISKAARILGIGRNTLYRKLKNLYPQDY